MSHTLERQTNEVARRAKRLSVSYGIAASVATAVAAGIVLGAVDYLFRVQDTGVRIILSGAWCAATGWAAWKFAWPTLRQTWPEITIARMIERRHPQLRDRLSTALAFLSQRESDPHAGSADLRRAVIGETTDAVSSLDLTDVLDSQPTRRMVGVAFGVLAFLLLIGSIAPAVTSQAAARLALPLGAHPWPRVHQLRFTQAPTIIASGGHFEVRLVDEKGRLPEDVHIFYWQQDQPESQAQAFPMQRVDDAMSHHLSNVTRPFKYRAAGGDDQSMEWIELQVVEPPRIVQANLRLTPPEYTGWPEQSNVARGSLRVVEGTRIQLEGLANKSLSSVAVHVRQGEEEDEIIPGAVVNGQAFRIPAIEDAAWVAGRSGEYWCQLTDQEGLEAGSEDRWELRVLPDQAPAVSLTEPEDNAAVTSRAVVPVRGTAKDDLAIHRIELRFSRSDQSDVGEQAVTLYAGPDRVAYQEAATTPEGAAPTPITIDHAWDLSQLGLPPQTVLSYYLTAEDYKPQSKQTMVRRLTIVTDDELQDRIVRRQSVLLARLAEVLEEQRRARGQVASVEIQLEEKESVDKPTVDQLHATELIQRRAVDTLAGEGDSILGALEGLRLQLQRNGLEASDVRQRLVDTTESIRRLRDTHLGTIQQQLITALKAMQATLQQADGGSVDPSVSTSLASAGRHQESVIETLEQLLQRMARFDSYRRFEREISHLRRQQETITENTADVGSRTLTREFASLPAADRAELRTVARRQSDLARRLDKAFSNLAQAGQELRQTEPQAAAAIEDALASARQAAIGGLMREAGRMIEQNRIGLASQQQQEIDDALREALELLSNRGEPSLDRRLEKQREAARVLRELRRRQADLTSEFADARQEPDPTSRRRQLERLAKRQRTQAREAGRLGRQLARLRAESAGQHASQAARHGDQATQASQRNDAESARQQSSLAQEQLDRAQAQLDEQTQRTQSQLAQQQVAHLRQIISGLVQQQSSMTEETVRLQLLQQQQGKLTIAQQASVTALAAQQQGLGAESAAVARQLSQSAAFEWVMDSAAQSMRLAGEQLDQFDTSDSTQEHQRDALGQLEQIVEALRENPDESSQNGGNDQGQRSGSQNDSLQELSRRLAELKLLKIMQEWVNGRTGELERARQERGGLTAEQEMQLRDLERRQGRLADIVFDLSQPPAAPAGGVLEEAIAEPAQPGRELDGLDKELDEILKLK